MSFCPLCGRQEVSSHCTCIQRNPLTIPEVAVIFTSVMIFPQILLLVFENTNLSQMFISAMSLAIFLFVISLLDYFIHRNYLALFFGCHQKSERSLRLFDHVLPICSRCSGILLGVFLGLPFIYFDIMPWLIALLLGLPLLIDGLIQHFSHLSSTHPRRIVTGIMFAQTFLFFFSKYQVLIYRLIHFLAEKISVLL